MHDSKPYISSCLASGSGASVVHNTLASNIENYICHTYNPKYEYLPPLLMTRRKHASGVMHTTPDHAVFVTPKRSKLVITFHNYYLDKEFTSQSKLIKRLHYRTDLRHFTQRALHRADAVTAVSSFIADVVKDDLKFRGDIKVIPNGINANRFFPAAHTHNGIRVLFCANLSQRKGAHLLEPIAKALNPGIELWVASGLRGGNFFSGGVPSNVRILGPIPYEDIPRIYNSVDMLIAPTMREGFGLTVAEAMASGIPVIGSKNSAIPQLIIEDHGGYLPSENSPLSFAYYINYLSENRKKREEMGSFNRERIINNFNEDDMIMNYRELFLELT